MPVATPNHHTSQSPDLKSSHGPSSLPKIPAEIDQGWCSVSHGKLPTEEMPESSDSQPEIATPAQQALLRALENLVTRVPSSLEKISTDPHERAQQIVRAAKFKAGALSAGLAIPPGPIGMLTVIPDLLQVWKIQRQMVSDIAACFGKSAQLTQTTMVYCLFRHGAAMLARDLFFRIGERFILKRGSLRMIQKILRHVSIKMTQRAIGRSISRWVPIVGPVVVGTYSMLDTRSVGKTAIETFSREIEIEPE
jgi:hypothetical protein